MSEWLRRRVLRWLFSDEAEYCPAATIDEAFCELMKDWHAAGLLSDEGSA